MIANLVSNSTEDWVNIFPKNNGNLYINQWIIVDYKLFSPLKQIPEQGLVKILENLPGNIVITEDVTKFLNTGYWPS